MTDLSKQFYAAVDRMIPQEIDGYAVSTDPVIHLVNQDAVAMQFFLVGHPDNVFGFVTASGRELREASEDIESLAARRVDVGIRCINRWLAEWNGRKTA